MRVGDGPSMVEDLAERVSPEMEVTVRGEERGFKGSWSLHAIVGGIIEDCAPESQIADSGRSSSVVGMSHFLVEVDPELAWIRELASRT